MLPCFLAGLLSRLLNSISSAAASSLRVWAGSISSSTRPASAAFSAPATSSTGNTGTVREGVLVLAASTQAQAVRYETITDTLKLAAGGLITGTLPLTTTATTAPRPTPTVKPKEPPVRWVIPVELIAALNAAQNSSFTLVLLPEAPQLYTTAGLTLADMRNQAASEEPRR